MRILRGIISIVLILILAAALYIAGQKFIGGQQMPKIFGYSHAVVLSGSMEPEFSAGDALVFKEQEKYEEGDIIAFHDEEAIVTHRIIEDTGDGLVTKGDANNAPDAGPVQKEDIEGRMVLIIPNAGSVLLFFGTPLGMLVLITAAVLLWEMPNIIGYFRRKGEKA